MMKNKLIIPVFFALVSIFTSCDKVEDRAYLGEVDPPVLTSVPEMELKRANAADTLVFTGTLIDPGYQASVKYLLQVRPAGDLAAKPSSIYSNPQDTLIKISVGDLNGYLKAKAKPWIPTSLDFMIKAELNSSAGTGAEIFSYVSAPVAVMVTTYGDPRLDVIDADGVQELDLESGIYTATIDLLNANSFTLFNPETGITYGGSGGTLVVGGAAIVPPFDGEYILSVDIEEMTYELTRISAAVMDVVGTATEQSLKSPTGNGIYTGMALLDPATPFTFLEVDTDVAYGGSDEVLIVDGAAIDAAAAGWHMVTVNVNDMSYTLDPYQVGVVGAFNGWAAPDTLMDYNPDKGFWFVTMDLPAGPMKFRLNEAWDIRWGPGTNSDLPENGGTIVLPNSDADINITTAGNYSIELTITSNTTGSAKFKLN